MEHLEMARVYREEYEKRTNNQDFFNPALDWVKVTEEVESLNGRNPGLGYFAYASRRQHGQMSHEEAIAWVVKYQIWR